MNYTAENLLDFLPSNQQTTLTKAIGKRLLEIERYLHFGIERFINSSLHAKTDFFSRNIGAAQLWFEGNLNHALTAYTDHFSVVVLPEVFAGNDFDKQYKLSEVDDRFVEKGFKDCLGQVCKDIKIWTYFEDYVQGEAAQAGISYVFSNGSELLYSIYLHGDLTEDFLLIDFPIPPEIVADCYSVANQCSIKYP